MENSFGMIDSLLAITSKFIAFWGVARCNW